MHLLLSYSVIFLLILNLILTCIVVFIQVAQRYTPKAHISRHIREHTQVIKYDITPYQFKMSFLTFLNAVFPNLSHIDEIAMSIILKTFSRFILKLERGSRDMRHLGFIDRLVGMPVCHGLKQQIRYLRQKIQYK